MTKHTISSFYFIKQNIKFCTVTRTKFNKRIGKKNHIIIRAVKNLINFTYIHSIKNLHISRAYRYIIHIGTTNNYFNACKARSSGILL